MSDDTVTIEINGVAHEARKGAMLIEVADAAGVRIPRFCYHRKLSVAANCRMCLVEVERAPKPMPACATPVMDGMKVFTDSDLAVDAQRAVMEFLLINHPLDCPICDQGGECELQDVAMGYGRGVSRFHERKRVIPDENLGPLIATDMTRCIHCTRCVRFGVEIAGIPELGVTGRGEHMRIGTFVERTVSSELSGNVIDVCPVGALTSKPFRFRARSWEMTQRETVAPHDAIGSNMFAHIKGSRVMRVVPRDNEAVNEVWISDRDRFSYEGLYSEDRLLTPRVKRDGAWVDVDWDVALQDLAQHMRDIDPSQLGALISPSSTVEEHYLLQKVMRGLGSPNIDHRLRQLDSSDQDLLAAYPHLGQSIEALEQIDAALLVGSNCRKEQPLVNHRLRKAALKGAAIMALNPARYAQNFDPGPSIVVSPSEMARALAAVAVALIEQGASPDPAFAAALNGVTVQEAHEAVAQRLTAALRPTVLLGQIAMSHPDAATLRALAGYVASLAGATLGYLSDGANSAGAALAGTLPHRGPGANPATDRGLATQGMFEAGLKGFVLVNVEAELDCADGAAARAALRGAEFVVSLSAYVSAEMEGYADILLPIAPFAETPGTYVNAAGTWQGFEDVVHPQGNARPAWRVLRVLGNILELDGFQYRDTASVVAEVHDHGTHGPVDNLGAWKVPDGIRAADGTTWRCGEVPMYSVDSVVRRSKSLQQTLDAGAANVRLNAALAGTLGLTDGGRALVSQGAQRAELEVAFDDSIADGCIHVAAGIEATSALGASVGPASIAPVALASSGA